VRERVPQATVEGAPGRRTSFEVCVDGDYIHSKLKTMAFPDHDEVAAIVADVAAGQAVRQVTKTTSDGACVVM